MVLGLGAHEGTHCLSVFGTPSKFCAIAGPLIDEARFREGKGAELGRFCSSVLENGAGSGYPMRCLVLPRNIADRMICFFYPAPACADWIATTAVQAICGGFRLSSDVPVHVMPIPRRLFLLLPRLSGSAIFSSARQNVVRYGSRTGNGYP